jgi:hypothetical protein
MYPGAEFLDSYDAGQGQRYVLFGTDAPFATVAAFYKDALRNNGRDIFPGIRQYELADFRSDRMAYPPSVVVKDYASSTPAGYLFAKGSTERRYPTIIQVVPPPPVPAR